VLVDGKVASMGLQVRRDARIEVRRSSWKFCNMRASMHDASQLPCVALVVEVIDMFPINILIDRR